MLLQSNVINQLHQAEELFDDEILSVINTYTVAVVAMIATSLGGKTNVTWQYGGAHKISMGWQIRKCAEIP
jgi:hypothetical protein